MKPRACLVQMGGAQNNPSIACQTSLHSCAKWRLLCLVQVTAPASSYCRPPVSWRCRRLVSWRRQAAAAASRPCVCMEACPSRLRCVMRPVLWADAYRNTGPASAGHRNGCGRVHRRQPPHFQLIHSRLACFRGACACSSPLHTAWRALEQSAAGGRRCSSVMTLW